MRRRRFIAAAAVAVAARAQPQFEIATVKRSPETGADRIDINLGGIRDGKLTLGNASLSDCLKFAYGLTSDLEYEGPDWIRSKAIRFDVVAQVPRGTTREQALAMLQTLLADRLKLQVHHEQKSRSFLALVVGKSGPKLKAGDPEAPRRGSNLLGKITSNQMTMGTLAMLLSRLERENILDMTGLTGVFEVSLEWAHDTARPLASGENEPDSTAGPSLFTAVQKQLGLKLESRKGPIDVLIVDHAEQVPVEN
jgi:uncharacterized protein (TIGR03435 family)